MPMSAGFLQRQTWDSQGGRVVIAALTQRLPRCERAPLQQSPALFLPSGAGPRLRLRWVGAGAGARLFHEGRHVLPPCLAQLVQEVGGGALGAVHLLHYIVPLCGPTAPGGQTGPIPHGSRRICVIHQREGARTKGGGGRGPFCTPCGRTPEGRPPRARRRRRRST